MLVPGILGFQGLLLVLVLASFLVIRHKWRNAVAKKEEIMRLVAMASEETAVAEFQATAFYAPVVPPPPPVSTTFHCVVCYASTTMRCSKCKAVRYCSSNCQIIHWRQGHKDECQPSIAMQFQDRSDFDGEAVIHHDGKGSQANLTSSSTESWDNRSVKPLSDGVALDLLENMPSPSESPRFSNCQEDISLANKLNKMKSSHTDKEVESTQKMPKAKTNITCDAQPENSGSKKLTRRATSTEKLVANASNSKISLSNDREDESKKDESLSHSASIDQPSSTTGEHLYSSSRSGKLEAYHALPSKVGTIPILPKGVCNGLKTSVRKVVQQFKSSKQLKSNPSGHGDDIVGKYKVIFPYELFVKLYSYDSVDLCPFGLINCGNSCYANAVFQCLAFTRPLASYLLQGLHSRACRKKDWCFICEFEILIMKAREGKSLLSPIRILSKIHKIGSHLGHGREEDAHEFLRYAVDTMQAVCLKEAGAVGHLAEETTLVGMTFGGYLRSKIKCMKCLGKSEIFERMMDLNVEIDGEIATLEEALAQFTATETLDGKNRYYCSRCKSYEKARKKLTVTEAPNILTIVLKRFQSRNFEKLNKSVQFPEVLNMSPYMGGASDKSPLYSLYAVVVHLDIMDAAYSAHYICYVKNNQGEWFKIDDSSVEPVELKRVLSEGAYMLLYARRTPRPPAVLGSSTVSNSGKFKRRNLEAVPSSLTKSKLRSNSMILSFTSNGSPNSDPGAWRFHSTQRIPAMDSSSESSSTFSSSDASSCSTVSTKDSASSEDFSDYVFGEMGPSWYSQYSRHSSVMMSSSNFQDVDIKSPRRRLGSSPILCSDRSRHGRKSTSD